MSPLIQMFLISLFTLTLFSVTLFFMDVFGDRNRHNREEEELRILREIRGGINGLNSKVSQIVHLLQLPQLMKARITIMPKTVNVGETASAVIQGLDQNGQPFALDASYSVVYGASNPSAVSFSPVNPDGSDAILALSADPGDSISATITRPDGVAISATADVLTITAPAPVLTSATVVLQ